MNNLEKVLLIQNINVALVYQIKTTMTTQDLKNNRNEIVSTLTEKVGEENVKIVMQIMLGGIDCCDSIEELVESSLAIFEQNNTKSRRKVSKLAEMIGKIEQLESEKN